MKRPSKVKAAFLGAPVGALAGLVATLFALFVLMYGVGSFLRSTDILGDIIYASGWEAVGTLFGFVVSLWFGGFVAIVVLIDHFPFGRYRLRLVHKDDPTPEVFS